MKGFLNLINNMNKFHERKASENRSTSVVYGVHAILCGVFFIACVVLLAFGISFFEKGFGGMFLGLICALVGAVGSVALFVNGIINIVLQLIMNRRVFSFIAPIIFIACIAIMVVIAVLKF